MSAGVTDDDAVYVERSDVPLNPHGWTTFRQVGCFSREEEDGHNHQRHQRHHHKRSMMPVREDKLPLHQRVSSADEPSGDDSHDRRLSLAGGEPVRLLGHERTPEGCAAQCATKMGGGIGFFGIGFGDE